DLPYFGLVSDKSFEHIPPASLSLKDVEKDHILRVLKEANWNLNKAAEILGIHRNTLRLKMREYGIEKVNR
ncbi:MAG: helix-turn-helix domain-containing protein, partial [Candidatus Latescibacteria bacterium]|nr:helix-turn-helix domain-containing protein [Candidatus Latescibacterota bacterium]